MEKKINSIIKSSYIFIILPTVCIVAMLLIMIFTGTFSVLDDNEFEYLEFEKIKNIDTYYKSKAKLVISEIKYLVYKNKNVGLYVVSDGTKDYIVEIINNKYKKIETKLRKEGYYEINGIAIIPKYDMKNIIVEEYNKKNIDNKITVSEYNKKFGKMYLSQKKEFDNLKNANLIMYGICATYVLLFIFLFFVFVERTKKTKEKFGEEGMKQLKEEMNRESTKVYSSIRLALTDSYLLNLSTGLDAIKYEDIVWFYKDPFNFYNDIVMYSKEDDKIKKSYLAGGKWKISTEFDDFYKEVCNRCPNIIIGYSKENKEKFKEQYK